MITFYILLITFHGLQIFLGASYKISIFRNISLSCPRERGSLVFKDKLYKCNVMLRFAICPIPLFSPLFNVLTFRLFVLPVSFFFQMCFLSLCLFFLFCIPMLYERCIVFSHRRDFQRRPQKYIRMLHVTSIYQTIRPTSFAGVVLFHF